MFHSAPKKEDSLSLLLSARALYNNREYHTILVSKKLPSFIAYFPAYCKTSDGVDGVKHLARPLLLSAPVYGGIFKGLHKLHLLLLIEGSVRLIGDVRGVKVLRILFSQWIEVLSIIATCCWVGTKCRKCLRERVEHR